MNNTLRYIVIATLILVGGFIGLIYYLGATDPAAPKEVSVYGEWVTYRELTGGDPGVMEVFVDNPYPTDFLLYGEAQSLWFHEGIANAYLFTSDGELLWEGYAFTDERYVYDMVVPFMVGVALDEYQGEAVLIIQPDDELGGSSEYIYSTTLIIDPTTEIEVDEGE